MNFFASRHTKLPGKADKVDFSQRVSASQSAEDGICALILFLDKNL